MKRIGLLLLCVCLLLSLAACNKTADENSTPSGQVTDEVQQEDTQAQMSVDSTESTVTQNETTVTTEESAVSSTAGETTTITEESSRMTTTATTATTTKKGAVSIKTIGTSGTTRSQGTVTKKTTTTVTTTTTVIQTTTEPQYNSVLGGLKLSILGDSLSSYDGFSNVGTTNTTLLSLDKGAGMEAFLPSVYDTYWMQVARRHEMSLLVNNSWPGSLMRGSGDSAGAGSRAVNLHANTGALEGTNPDVIAVFMGTNDLFWSEPGTFSEDLYASLVTDRGNGVYTYAEGTDFAESYFIAMHKITTTYPGAKVFCFTLHPNMGCSDEVVQQFNAVIRSVAAHYDAPIVDLYNSELTATEAHLADSLHFNATGMKVVADLFEAALLAEFR